MRARIVNENIDFERGEDPKKSMGIGKNRYRQPGDEQIGQNFLSRVGPERNTRIFINMLNGKQIEIGLYAAKEVGKALRTLMD